MKKILIYGDSNVWGDNFYTNKRIDDDKQWPNILQCLLGSNYKVYQEGLPGRLAGNDEVIKGYKNGKDSFVSIFRTNAPVDTIIFMLGTNDLQMKYDKSSKKIIDDLLWYRDIIIDEFNDDDNKLKYFNNNLPNIIYILPANFSADEVFDNSAHEKRLEIIEYFKNSDLNYVVLDSMSLFEDGIHLDYKSHERVAQIINEELKKYE